MEPAITAATKMAARWIGQVERTACFVDIVVYDTAQRAVSRTSGLLDWLLMDSRQLHYFRTVVDKGSFTNAAASLNLTQPSLSLSIRKLEEELNAQLLTRGRSGSVPTEAGKYLYQVASRIDTLFDDATRRINDISAGVFGSVRISSVPMFNWEFMPEVLRRVIDNHPTIDVSLEDPKPSAVVTAVLSGKADIGLIPVSNPTEFIAAYRDELDVHYVAEYEFRLGVPQRLKDLPEPVSFADVREETLLLPYGTDHLEGVSTMMDNLWSKQPEIKPDRVIDTSTLQSAIPLVSGNIGVALMTENCTHMSGDRIIYKKIKEPLPPAVALAFHLRDRSISPAAAHFLEVLLEVGREQRVR